MERMPSLSSDKKGIMWAIEQTRGSEPKSGCMVLIFKSFYVMFNQRKPAHADIESKITGGQIDGSLQLDGGEYALFPSAISSDAIDYRYASRQTGEHAVSGRLNSLTRLRRNASHYPVPQTATCRN